MVSLPALLAEAPHIPYKLQLSLECCDFPHPHSFSDMEGRYGCRYEQVDWKHLSDSFVSCDTYLGGWQWHCDLCPRRSSGCGRPAWALWTLLTQRNTRNRYCVIRVRISVVIVTTWQLDTNASILRDLFCAVGLTRSRCMHLCSVWTLFIKKVVCHTYSPG